MTGTLEVRYDYLKDWKLIVSITSFVVLLYLSIAYLHPSNSSWLVDGSFSWGNFLSFVLLDQILIECITFAILAWLVRMYATLLKVSKVGLSGSGWLRYQLLFLPLFLSAFFVFNPITQTSRYVYHQLVQDHVSDYWSEYFYSFQLYISYLMPVLVGGYLLINVNLFQNYRQRTLRVQQQFLASGKLEISDDVGKRLMDVADIYFIERVGRQYHVSTTHGIFRISKNLNELEILLSGFSFFRVNRSVLINLSFLKNYSYWENEKYIVRLTTGNEFVASRGRIAAIRSPHT